MKEPKIDFDYPLGYFNGASQGSPWKCGFGLNPRTSEHHEFLLIYGVGLGSNNRVEFFTS